MTEQEKKEYWERWFYGIETLPLKEQLELVAAKCEYDFNEWVEKNIYNNL